MQRHLLDLGAGCYRNEPFGGTSLEKLKQVLSFVWMSHAPFYREKYRRAGFDPSSVHTEADLERIPLLTRAELQACAPLERLYLPLEDTLVLGHTSGTTSSRVLPLWRNYYDAELPSLDASNMLVLFAQPWRALGQAEWFRRGGLFALVGEVGNLPVAAELAAETGVDGLYTTPTLALLLAPVLGARYPLAKIRTLFLPGERLTAARRGALMELYPRAAITSHYVCSEIGPAGNLCPGTEPNDPVYHQDPAFWYEVLDADGKPCAAGEHGELVITTLSKVPGPMIRYRTGDVGALLGDPCACALRRPAFALAGRSGFDVVKVGGFELKVDNFEQGVSGVAEVIEQHSFEVHVYEEQDPHEPTAVRPRLAYKLVARRPLTEEEKERVAGIIRESTMVGVHTSLEEAERNGYMFETTFAFSTERTPLSGAPKKRTVLISHLA